jgi:two-component system CheB/CheR fusion protein
MSGGGSDGSRGIIDVHQAGGLVIVQDIDSAQFDGMPRTAVDSGVAHWVTAPQDMPRVLAEHAAGRTKNGQLLNGSVTETDVANGGVGVVYRMLQEEFGIDFTHYKPSTVTRRIERRLALARSQDIEEYVRRLKSERSELDVLYRDLLIEVTRFFRDEQAFKVLEEKILPELLRREPRDVPLTTLGGGLRDGRGSVLPGDLASGSDGDAGRTSGEDLRDRCSPGSLEHATRAVYGQEAVAGVTPERLARYFIRHGDRYQVVPDVRQMVVFAQHNVIKDAPFTRVDLITCRNLLIYLQQAAQQKVLSLFHFALTRGGAARFSVRVRLRALSRAASTSSTSTGGSIESATTRAYRSMHACIRSSPPTHVSRARLFSWRADATRCLSSSVSTTRCWNGSCRPACCSAIEESSFMPSAGRGASCIIVMDARPSTSSSSSAPSSR